MSGDAAQWVDRGNALYAQGRLAEAQAAYQAALELAPGVAAIHDNLGLVLNALGRPAEAIACHDRAIACDPRFAIAWLRRAMARRALGRFEEALADAAQAVALEPRSALALNGRGIVLNDLGRYAEAVDDYRAAIAAEPRLAPAHNNLGNALHDLGRHDEALEALRRALALQPGYAEALSNIGLVLQDQQRFDEARSAFDAAIAARADYAEAWKRRASLRLLLGDYPGGWSDYDTSLAHARRQAPGPLAHVRYWNGESLAGKSLLLTEPNGFGDTLQFWRFLPRLLDAGARLSFLGPARLFALLRGSGLPVRLLDALPPGERFDYQTELWSLPRILRIGLDDIPAPVPFLPADAPPAPEAGSLAPQGSFNIGICWQGNPDRKIDAGRSVPLRAFAPLARVPGVRLVSLQRMHGLDQLRALSGELGIVDPGARFDAGDDAFLDTAALVRRLDLVVSSDTAVAHLAGSLGRPTWVALKRVPEWRWMLRREDSPWYPGMRLFRQPRPGDWDAVFEAMAAALAAPTSRRPRP